jgi:hypothetical protein
MEDVTPTSAQCEKWQAFLDELTPDKPYGSVTLSGTFGPTGITITDATAAQQLAFLLHTRTAGTVISDGDTWYVSTGCGTPSSCVEKSPAVELRVGVRGNCICSSSPAYTVRPDIGNPNWGGVNTVTCNNWPHPSQTMMVEFN